MRKLSVLAILLLVSFSVIFAGCDSVARCNSSNCNGGAGVHSSNCHCHGYCNNKGCECHGSH